MLSKFLIFGSISSAILNFFAVARNTTTHTESKDETLYNQPATAEKKLTFAETVFEPNKVEQTAEPKTNSAEYEVPVNDKDEEAKTFVIDGDIQAPCAACDSSLDNGYSKSFMEYSDKKKIEIDEEEEEEKIEIDDEEDKSETDNEDTEKMLIDDLINKIAQMIPKMLEDIKNDANVEEAKLAMNNARREWNDARTQCTRRKYSQDCKTAVYEKQKQYRKAEWTVFDSVQKLDKAVFDLRQFSDDFVQRHAPKLISEALPYTVVFFDPRNKNYIVEKNDLTEIASGVALKL